MKLKYYNLLMIFVVAVMAGCSTPGNGDDKNPVYLDPGQPVENRVEDLMSRMTLEEKIGQMCQYVAIKHIEKTKAMYKNLNKGNDQYGMYPGLSADDLREMVRKGEIGSFLHVKDVKEANELQKLAMESRLKVPLIIGIDAIHGQAHIWGATVYPTQLSLSSTWDDSLLYEVAKETAKEVRATGMHWTFSPNVEVARDPRWGRTGETFGEDPFLISRMGVAFTKGYQGNFGPDNILACAKHFVGGGEPFNGTNAAPIDVSERQLREIWFPPYKAQIEAGVYTLMASHNEVSGVPAHGNKWLLTNILRDEWGFKGFVVSDWMDIERIHTLHHAAETPEEAIRISVEAGMDMHMHGPGFLEPLAKMVKEGKVPEADVDRAVSKILKAKFMLGLFEKPYADENKAKKILFSKEHQATALKAAREAIILLKNDGLLPLKGKKSILVTGPNANNDRIMGDWALKQPEENITTVYEGIKQVFTDAKVDFINSGESLRNPDDSKLKEPIAKAGAYDAVVVVVGSNSLRFDSKEKNCGENIDRANITLQGNQMKLLKGIYEKNKNVVVVLVNGRPLGEKWIKENIPAVIEAWEPGAFGGQAIAEVIKGDVNPSGKLTISIPYSSAQINYFYNHKPSSFFHPYIDMPSKPLWYFGYGMSYTTYEYSNLKVQEKANIGDKSFKVSVDVTNSGDMDGDEIVQLYIRDDYSSVTRPVKELKDYKRIHLKKGETKTVEFNVPFDALAFYNLDMKYVVEPGTFTVMVGPSSIDDDLLKGKLTVNK
ncbi:MAG: beta-glucosidase [Chlorobi bacterium]|nr:beta-glucosidase [Chlorobiota bacterium]